ncbi:helix-turn-helix domain-containing protein [Actinoplanes sp. CA-131856]
MDIDSQWWDTATFEGRPINQHLADRDVSAALRFLRARGFSRARLAGLTGLSETRVRQIAQGRQRVTSFEVLERVADGLRIPRPYLGLAASAETPQIGFTDPDLRDSWDALLGVLNGRSNMLGCAGLRRPAEGQWRLITAARVAATGRQRSRLMSLEAHWAEFLSWIEANGTRPSRAGLLLDEAYALAVEAGDQHLAAYILMRKSQQALDEGDAARAGGLAQQAGETPKLPPRTSALCLIREAEAHALADDAVASRESINRAHRFVAQPTDAVDHLGGHCSADYVRASEARCRQMLGESAAASKTYEEVLAAWPPDGRLDEGLWRADLALAYLDEGESERAAHEGLAAVRIGGATSSARTLRAVGRLLPRLRRHRELAVLPQLTQAHGAALAGCDD